MRSLQRVDQPHWRCPALYGGPRLPLKLWLCELTMALKLLGKPLSTPQMHACGHVYEPRPALTVVSRSHGCALLVYRLQLRRRLGSRSFYIPTQTTTGVVRSPTGCWWSRISDRTSLLSSPSSRSARRFLHKVFWGLPVMRSSSTGVRLGRLHHPPQMVQHPPLFNVPWYMWRSKSVHR